MKQTNHSFPVKKASILLCEEENDTYKLTIYKEYKEINTKRQSGG